PSRTRAVHPAANRNRDRARAGDTANRGFRAVGFWAVGSWALGSWALGIRPSAFGRGRGTVARVPRAQGPGPPPFHGTASPHVTPPRRFVENASGSVSGEVFPGVRRNASVVASRSAWLGSTSGVGFMIDVRDVTWLYPSAWPSSCP